MSGQTRFKLILLDIEGPKNYRRTWFLGILILSFKIFVESLQIFLSLNFRPGPQIIILFQNHRGMLRLSYFDERH